MSRRRKQENKGVFTQQEWDGVLSIINKMRETSLSVAAHYQPYWPEEDTMLMFIRRNDLEALNDIRAIIPDTAKRLNRALELTFSIEHLPMQVTGDMSYTGAIDVMCPNYARTEPWQKMTGLAPLPDKLHAYMVRLATHEILNGVLNAFFQWVMNENLKLKQIAYLLPGAKEFFSLDSRTHFLAKQCKVEAISCPAPPGDVRMLTLLGPFIAKMLVVPHTTPPDRQFHLALDCEVYGWKI